ncbi:MAG: hypothetical protein HY290_09185 [Planctomycetia bacterium]|nr:hypothetical protein [Planctomycetia bacterium]
MKFLSLVTLLLVVGSALAVGRFDDQNREAVALAESKKAGVQRPPAFTSIEKILASLNKPTNVEWSEFSLEAGLAHLGEFHNIAIRLDRPSLEAAKVSTDHQITVKLSGVPLRSLFEVILEPLSLGIFVGEGELVVTTREKAAAQLGDCSLNSRHQLSDILRAGISAVDLGEAITQTIDPASWQRNGGQGWLKAEPEGLRIEQRMDVRGHLDILLRELKEAIRDPQNTAGDNRLHTQEYSIADLNKVGLANAEILALLDQSLLAGKSPADRENETATIKGDRLTLTQPRWILDAADGLLTTIALICNDGNARANARFLINTSLLPFEPRRRIIRKKLTLPISVDFQELPLADSVVFAAEYSGLKFLFRKEQITNAGIRLDLPVTMKEDKKSLVDFLDELLLPLNLDWYMVDPDVIAVTTRAAAAKHLEPRVYRTAELLAASQTEKGLVARIAAIDPESWAARGGPGQMRPLPGVLIVFHNRRVHDQIAKIMAAPQ